MKFNLSILALSVCVTASAKQKTPNVIYILADDLGWSDVSYKNGSNDFYETPFIDKLSSEGLRFNCFYPGGANSAPSRANLITGMSNVRSKIYTPSGKSKGKVEHMRLDVPAKANPQHQPFESKIELSPTVVSVAELVNSVGYRTARIGKWHLGSDNQGFDESSSDGAIKDKDLYADPQATERIASASTKFIEQNKDNPFFLYVAFFDVHTPLKANQKIVAKYKAKWLHRQDKSRVFNPIYAAMIEQVDNAVEEIYNKVCELGLEGETLIIFGSDNGGVGNITDNSPLKGAKGNLYEGGIRTPAFAVWKGVIKPNTVTDTPFHGTDLMPTLAELSGAKLPKNQAVDGVSIVPLLKGKTIKERALFWHYPMYLDGKNSNNGWASEKLFNIYGTNTKYWRAVPSSAILKSGWKLIHFYETDSDELYYLPDDIGEKNNLKDKHPNKVKELKTELNNWLKETKADIPQIKKGQKF